MIVTCNDLKWYVMMKRVLAGEEKDQSLPPVYVIWLVSQLTSLGHQKNRDGLP